MTKRQIDDDQIRRYLAEQMQASELDSFEEALLGDPELLEAVRIERTLITALKDAESELIAGADKVADIKTLRPVTNNVWRYLSAMAASLLVGVVLTQQYMGHQGQPAIVDDIVYVSPARSTTVAPPLLISGQKTTMLVIDAIEFDDSPGADLSLAQQGKVVFSLTGLVVNPDLQFNILLPQLDAGEYRLQLTDRNHHQEITLVVE